MKKLLPIILIFLLIVACEKVAPYQKVHLNLDEIKLTNSPSKTQESNFISYREGSSGANGGKTGGGCGCN